MDTTDTSNEPALIVNNPQLRSAVSCQKAHWPVHKQECKRRKIRKAFFRAVDVLQAIFYNYREVMFDVPIARVEEHDGILWIFEGPEPKLERDVDVLVGSLDIGELSWEGNIEELSIQHKPGKRCTRRIFFDGMPDTTLRQHSLWRVSLKGSNEIYALDLTGAQVGYYEPVVPFEVYKDQRIEYFQPRAGFSFFEGNKQLQLCCAKSAPTPYHCYVPILNNEMWRVMVEAVRDWEAQQEIEVKELWALQEEEFLENKRELVTFVDNRVKRALEKLRASGEDSTDANAEREVRAVEEK
ncbi:hypothetical protein B0J14DRAFT_635644 [Halenospora varia]|nr:hypothetical protein B0J14DRAFT_635644 [Halenospora varia]